MRLPEVLDQSCHIIDLLEDKYITQPYSIYMTGKDFCQRMRGIKEILSYWSVYLWNYDYDIDIERPRLRPDDINKTQNLHIVLDKTFKVLCDEKSCPELKMRTWNDGEHEFKTRWFDNELYDEYQKLMKIMNNLAAYYCFCCRNFDESMFKSLQCNDVSVQNILICSHCGTQTDSVSECKQCHEAAVSITLLKELRG